MDPDRGVEVGVGRAHDGGHRPAGRHPGHVHPIGRDVVLLDGLTCDAGDDRRLSPAALLVRSLEPVPALRAVGGGGLRGIGYEEGVYLGERVHAGARGEIVGILGTAVEHDDQWHRLPGVTARDVQLVRAPLLDRYKTARRIAPLSKQCRAWWRPAPIRAWCRESCLTGAAHHGSAGAPGGPAGAYAPSVRAPRVPWAAELPLRRGRSLRPAGWCFRDCPVTLGQTCPLGLAG